MLGKPPGDTSGSDERPTAAFDTEAAENRDRTSIESPLAPGERFGPRYRILARLGGGGMGIVYKAWDETIGIEVALKVIRPKVMDDPNVARELEERFKRELLLARKVTHKNVVRIHDLGKMNGITYITMTFVTGADLATLLGREVRLPIPRTLRIARQLVDGLDAAHQAGVVHRDLKPANIMVGDTDAVLIMDFGIARSSAREDRPGSDARPGDGHLPPEPLTGVTVPGAILGTLEYMAPEQARGENFDHRADIYAFGLILFDMLVGLGRHKIPPDPRTGRGEPVPEPQSARHLDPDIPESLDRIIQGCLEPQPSARYPSCTAVAADLARLDEQGRPLPVAWRFSLLQVAAALVMTATALVGTWWFTRSPPPPEELAPISILLADFDNQTGDDLFDGTIENALALSIESASFITTYPRPEAARVAAQITPGAVLDEASARLVALREDVDVVLSGAIRAEGSGYAVAIRAVDPSAEGALLEAEEAAADKAGVLQAVAALGSEVRESLGDTTSEAAGETFTAGSLEAARAYSIAQDLAEQYQDQEAIVHYRRATEEDPNFGRAFAGWAYSAFRLGRMAESERAWEKALALVDRMTGREKYRTLGLYYGTVARNYDKAIESYETLLQIYPADDAGHNNLAMAYFSTRDFEKALEHERRALEIYPSILMYRVNYALFAMYASDFQRAEDEARRILEDHPDFYDAYLPVAIAALSRSDFETAGEAYGRLAESGEPGASLADLGLADLAIFRGLYTDAVEILRRSIANDEAAEREAFLATKYVALGEAFRGREERDSAIDAVESALKLQRREEVLLPAARTLIWAGRSARALELQVELDSELEPLSRAYAKVVAGELAFAEERHADALDAFRDAGERVDLWLTRFDIGVLYVEAERYAEALSELELCKRRAGEASAIFLDDVPTYRYLAPLPYWLGRAREGLGMNEAAAESYQTFLDRRSESTDALTADARRRLEAIAR